MKRSLLYQLGGPEAIEFESLAREVRLADELGIDTVWCFPAVGEDGHFAGNAPEIWLSGLASRTERIRLGWGIAELLPPAFPPMRVAEQGASLDLASEGRLELALLPETELSEERTNRGDPLWQEGLRMLVEMWDEPTFSWTSERFDVRPIDVLPKPVQKPHPPIWLAGWSASHARAAGRGGLAFLDLSGAEPDQLEIHRDAYTESRAECDPNDLVSVAAVGVAAELEASEAGGERLASLESLGIDEAILRVGPLEGGHEEALERIRFLASGTEAPVH